LRRKEKGRPCDRPLPPLPIVSGLRQQPLRRGSLGVLVVRLWLSAGLRRSAWRSLDRSGRRGLVADCCFPLLCRVFHLQYLPPSKGRTVARALRSPGRMKKAPAGAGAKCSPGTKKGSPAARTAARSKRFRITLALMRSREREQSGSIFSHQLSVRSRRHGKKAFRTGS
jgi:hypothetical protein